MLHAHVIHNFFGPFHLPSQMPPQLVHPFLHGLCHIFPLHYIASAIFLKKMRFSVGICTPYDTRFFGSAQPTILWQLDRVSHFSTVLVHAH